MSETSALLFRIFSGPVPKFKVGATGVPGNAGRGPSFSVIKDLAVEVQINPTINSTGGQFR